MIYIGKYSTFYNGEAIKGFRIFRNKEDYILFQGQIHFIADMIDKGCLFTVYPFDDIYIPYSKSEDFIKDFKFIISESHVDKEFFDDLLGKGNNEFGFFPTAEVNDFMTDFNKEEKKPVCEPLEEYIQITFFDYKTDKSAEVGPFYASFKGWSYIEIDAMEQSYITDLKDSTFGKDKDKYYPDVKNISEEEYNKNMNY